MSVAETLSAFAARRPIVPPRPAPASESMTSLERMRTLKRSAIGTWSSRAYEEDIIRGRFLGRGSFILNNPDAIRHVLVDNYENYTRTPVGIRVLRPILGEDGLLLAHGKSWKLQRRTLAPAFSPRAVSLLTPHMIAATNAALAELDQVCGQPYDLREAMQRLALDIAGRTMFSFALDRHGSALRSFVNDYGDRLARPHLLDLLFPLSWPTPSDFARAKFRREWTRFLSVLIAERREMGPSTDGPRDLFDLMVEARDPETGEAFADHELADQIATMILAGHETTATALFWALYLLALDPATQDELAAEAQQVPDAGRSDPKNFPFARAVLDETMRLYPPAFLIARAASGPDVIAGSAVKKNDVILISPWLLHRHVKSWDRPDTFLPERFLSDSPSPHRFAYMPFGAGPRVCIGAQFALTEATLALAHLIGRFRVTLLSDRPALPMGVVTTQPDHSPVFQVERR